LIHLPAEGVESFHLAESQPVRLEIEPRASVGDCLRRAAFAALTEGAFRRREGQPAPIYQQTSIGLPTLGSNRSTIIPIQVPQFATISHPWLRAQQV